MITIPRLLLVLGLCGLAGLVRELQASPPDPALRTQTTYYASGKVRTEGTYHDGRKNGPSQAFYADGTKQSEGAYENGEMTGRWSFWLQSGELDVERSGLYAAGVRTLP